MSSQKNIDLILKIWRQVRPEDSGRFDTISVNDVDPNMSFLVIVSYYNICFPKIKMRVNEF